MSFGFGFALPAYPLRGGGGNNPFNQLGPTLDLSFTGVVTDLTDPNGYTLNTDFIIPQYQIAAQYVVWETGVGLVDKTFSQIITFTRASIGTYFDSAGVLQTAAINAPRFDYNPSTLAAQGFLIEEARTNSIRNNTMQGAVAGTPGTGPTNWVVPGTVNGLTQTIAVGTENGISYIDLRYAGTATATGSHQVSFEAANQIVAASGQTWTRSAWFKTQAGSTANVTVNHNLQGRDAGNTTFTETFVTDITASLTGTLTRLSTASTLANASTAFVRSAVTFVYNNGATIDITLRIGLPQLELGAFATSVIPTTTTALTRSADVANVNTLSPWFNSPTGTIYAESQQIAVQTGLTFPRSTQIDDGSNNNLITTLWRADLNRLYGAVTTGGVNQADVGTNGVTQTSANKIALAYATNDFAVSTNGGVSSTDTSGTVPTGLTTLRIGAAFGSSFLNGWLRRIVYYPRRLTNAELQTITLPTGATITTQDYSLDTNFVGNTVAIGS